jgi:hypothetical protein
MEGSSYVSFKSGLLSRYLHRGTEGDYEICQVILLKGIDIWTRDLPSTKQQCCLLNREAQ